MLSIIVASLIFLPLYHSDFFFTIVKGTHFFNRHGTIFFMACLISACGFCFADVLSKKPIYQPSTLVWFIAISAMLLQMFAWRIIDINLVSDDGVWWLHADAALYAASQVFAGKTILVDLPSQYGFFPEVVAPIFKIIKPSIANIGSLFSLLQIISMVGLFYVLSKLINRSWLMILASLSLITLTFETVIYFSNIYERYFQYWPIRFFWPSISVISFYFYAINKTLPRTLYLSILSAIGTFCVMDTGLFILLAFAAYLGLRFIILCLTKNSPEDWQEAKGYLKAQ